MNQRPPQIRRETCEHCGRPLEGLQRRWCRACLTRRPHVEGRCDLCGGELDGIRRAFCSRCSPRARAVGNLERESRDGARPSAAGVDQRARRSCLRCGKMFASNGPWNRQCRRCRDLEKRSNAITPGRIVDHPVHVGPEGLAT